ncbi:MAG: Ig-like domain-containing protein, partial [Candidatus Norongarragalinales archaeon]
MTVSCTYGQGTFAPAAQVSKDTGEEPIQCTSSSFTIGPPPHSAPTVTISSPPSTVTGGQPVSFSGTASPASGYSVVSVSLQFCSGLSCGSWTGASGTSSWSYSWTAPNNDAQYTVKVKAVDNTGLETNPPATASFSVQKQQSQAQGSCAVQGGSGVVGQPTQVRVSY